MQYNAQTDTKNKFIVDSHIVSAEWMCSMAVGKGNAPLVVKTVLVGNGATIEISGLTSKGKAPGKIKGTVYNNCFTGELPIPEKVHPEAEIWFEAKLPKHGLKMESDPIPAHPPIVVSSFGWDRNEVLRGETVLMKAKFENVKPDISVTVIVYEYNPDGHHDKIATIPTELKGATLEVLWEFDYFDKTENIPTHEELQKYNKNYNHPSLFFIVLIGGVRVGEKQESGLLKFKDSLEFVLQSDKGDILGNHDVVLKFADGTTKTITSDNEGNVKVEKIAPGPVKIEI